MSQDDAKGAVAAAVSVPRQRVVIAKDIIVRSIGAGSASAQHLLHAVVTESGTTVPEKLILHSSVDLAAAIKATADGISWKLAAIEAICSLVGAGVLIAGGNIWNFNASIGYTTVPPGGGSGHSGGIDWPEFSFSCPADVRLAPSLRGEGGRLLDDPDLYLNTLAISNMHADISAALCQAVKCYRAELFLAAVAMLGKVSEGSWIELGASLLEAAGTSNASALSKQRDVLDDPMIGTGRKVEAVTTMYQRKDIFGAIADESGIRPQELRSIALWSDTVRDSRNTLHFLARPSIPNTYEKVGVLLLAAAQPLRTLYAVKEVADRT